MVPEPRKLFALLIFVTWAGKWTALIFSPCPLVHPSHPSIELNGAFSMLYSDIRMKHGSI
jgi:hypothetical protein